MDSSITRSFRKCLRGLPATIREQALHAYRLWPRNPYHGSLQFKQVSKRQPVYSVRIGLHHRALGLAENRHINWFRIDVRKAYDALLRRI